MGDITEGSIVASMGEKRRIRNQVKRVMNQRDETIKVLELNADIAQSRIEELEDVQISLEQDQRKTTKELESWRFIWEMVHDTVPSGIISQIEDIHDREGVSLPVGFNGGEE
tara:strand:- start:570 stop:905 length:336 start_codon:yes stop_codon:yes gene_type:complete